MDHKDPWDQRDLKENLDLLDVSVCLDSQVSKDRWELKEPQESQVYQLNQERKDQMVLSDSQDLLVSQDGQETMDPKEKTETREIKEKEARKENLEAQDSMDHQE